tara:strand:- start:1059 stop:1595 length:537 start_codon:yes stop_codon:yes gene_type:complete
MKFNLLSNLLVLILFTVSHTALSQSRSKTEETKKPKVIKQVDETNETVSQTGEAVKNSVNTTKETVNEVKDAIGSIFGKGKNKSKNSFTITITQVSNDNEYVEKLYKHLITSKGLKNLTKGYESEVITIAMDLKKNAQVWDNIPKEIRNPFKLNKKNDTDVFLSLKSAVPNQEEPNEN